MGQPKITADAVDETEIATVTYVDDEIVAAGGGGGVTDHTLLTNIGTNAHSVIDTHLALTNEHLDWTADQGATNIHAGNYTDTDTVYTHPNHSGDVTSTGDGATVIGANKVTLGMQAQIATDSFLGRDTAAVGNVEVLSAAAVRTILNVESGSTADQSAAEILASLKTVDVNGATGVNAGTFDGALASTYALLASPIFTGTPSLPTGTTGVTQTASNNTTAIATTAFVHSGLVYDIAGQTLSQPTDAAILMQFSVNRAISLPIGLTNSFAESTVAPAAAAAYIIKKNGASIGTINFALGSNASTFTFSALVSLIAGDLLTVEAPATADTTHDQISWTLAATI